MSVKGENKKNIKNGIEQEEGFVFHLFLCLDVLQEALTYIELNMDAR